MPPAHQIPPVEVLLHNKTMVAFEFAFDLNFLRSKELLP
jgi:hypothetical protein